MQIETFFFGVLVDLCTHRHTDTHAHSRKKNTEIFDAGLFLLLHTLWPYNLLDFIRWISTFSLFAMGAEPQFRFVNEIYFHANAHTMRLIFDWISELALSFITFIECTQCRWAFFSLLLYNIFAPLLWLKICNGDECLDLHSEFIVSERKRANEVNERVWVCVPFLFHRLTFRVKRESKCVQALRERDKRRCGVPLQCHCTEWNECCFWHLIWLCFCYVVVVPFLNLMAYSVHWMNRVCLSRSSALSLFLLSFEMFSHYCVGCTAHSHFSVHLYAIGFVENEVIVKRRHLRIHTHITPIHLCCILLATIHWTPFHYHGMKRMAFSLFNTLTTVISWTFMQCCELFHCCEINGHSWKWAKRLSNRKNSSFSSSSLPSNIEHWKQRMKNIPKCCLRDVNYTHNKNLWQREAISSLPTLDGVRVYTVWLEMIIQSFLIGIVSNEWK